MNSGHFLRDLALVLCTAGVTTLICHVVRLPVVLGYLMAGILIGPHTPFPVFANIETTQQLAELGVILLMFSLGLEFNLRKLARLAPTAGVVTLVQVGLTFALGYQVGSLLGLDRPAAVLAGAIVSISSTMIVAHALQDVKVDRGVRELVLGVLIIEDLVAILMLAAVSTFATGGGPTRAAVLGTAGRLLLFIVGLAGVGLIVLPGFFRRLVALRRKETTLVASVGFCFFLALLAEAQGLSVALGAFLSGALISEAGVAKHVEPLVEPLRDLFTGLFFVSIGMLFDPMAAAAEWPLVLALVVVVVAGTAVGVSVGSFLAGESVRTSVQAALSLAQIGEFSFVIATLGATLSAGSARLFSVAVAVAITTSFMTPFLMRRAEALALRFDAWLPRPLQSFVSLYGSWIELARQQRGDSERRQLWGYVGWLAFNTAVLLGVLIATAVNLPWLVQRLGEFLNMSPAAARGVALLGAAAIGAPFGVAVVRVARGLAGRMALRALPLPARGLDQARAPRQTLARTLEVGIALAAGLVMIAVTGPILPRAALPAVIALVLLYLGVGFWRAATDLQGHLRAGAEVAAHVLAVEHRRLDSPDAALAQVERLLPGIGSLHAATVVSGGPADGRTLGDLNLRGLTGATVVAIIRGESPIVYPSGHEGLAAGDVLALSGTHEAIEKAERALTSGAT